MKVAILAGGLGTRISEDSHLKPKPMIEVGGLPILHHIMNHYSHYGFNDFVILAGYKQHIIKEYFADYYLHRADVTFDFNNGGNMIVHNHYTEPWHVTIIDTGLNTMTGGRLLRAKPYLETELFMLTYGDGVSDIDLDKLAEFHKTHGKVATLTSIAVIQRFGVVDTNGDLVTQFREKQTTGDSRINGGFFVFEPRVFEYLEDDTTILEKKPLETLAAEGQLTAYRHDGFWQCMDTKRDHEYLEKLWESGDAPWTK